MQIVLVRAFSSIWILSSYNANQHSEDDDICRDMEVKIKEAVDNDRRNACEGP